MTFEEARDANRRLWRALCRRANDPGDPIFANRALYLAERQKLEEICCKNYSAVNEKGLN